MYNSKMKKAAHAKSETDRTVKKSRKFRNGVLIYVSALTLICAGLLIYMWNYMAEMEERWSIEAAKQKAEIEARIEYRKKAKEAPQLAFEKWMDMLTADYWTDLWYEQSDCVIDKKENVYEYMSERFAPDKIKAYKAIEFTDSVPVYVIKSGDETLSRIKLSGSGLTWKISNVDLLIKGENSASVRVSEGCHVFCNGRELDSSYCKDDTDYFSFKPLKDKLIKPVGWKRYTVDGLLFEAELTVEPPEGRGIIKTQDGVYIQYLKEGTDIYKDKAVRFVRDYLNYYMNGRNETYENMCKVLSHLQADSQLYKDIKETYEGVAWNPRYNDIDISRTEASEVIVWADNCFSADVSYKAYCTVNDVKIVYADSTMRIYFLKTGDDVVISNIETF